MGKTGYRYCCPLLFFFRGKKYTSYRYPQLLNDSTIIAVKSDLDDLNYLVLLTDGKEERLTYIGRINSRLHIRNGYVYWTEIVPGIRWTYENYSVLKRYDPKEKRITTLTPRRRYLALAIDEQEKRAAVSCFTVDGKNRLVLVDLETGKEQIGFDVSENAFIKKLIFAVNDAGISLLQLDLLTGNWSNILSTTANITSSA